MARKRHRNPPSGPSSKRQKVDRSEPKNESEDLFKADQLDWKSVTLPDRLEDAEGFYGLEEIDDVDILHTPGQGQVIFKAPKTKIKRDQKDSHANGATAADTDEDDEAEEWDGFSDENHEPEPIADTKRLQDGIKEEKKPDNQKSKGRLQDKAKEEKKTKSKSGNQEANGIKPGLSFAALEDGTSEDIDLDTSAWDPLNLHSEIQISLSKLKFTTPTPIQSACIPAVFAGHDVVGKAATGSGKTLAFGIPILEHFLENQGNTTSPQAGSESRNPIALILAPTRELAHQISKHMTDLISNAPNTNAGIASLTGGLSIQKQQRLVTHADILIGTPGRLWEMISSVPGFLKRLKKIRFLVVDEADRLLSEGHFKEVEDILGALDRPSIDDDPPEGSEHESMPESEAESDKSNKNERQTLVFSATFHKGLQQKLQGKSKFLGGDLLDQRESMEYLLKKLNFREEKPKFIDVNPVSQMAENLKEGLVECPPMDKDLYLYALLLYHPKHRTLVFTNAISAVRRLTTFLQNLKLPVLALHSSMAQKARLRSVERFSSPSSDPSSILVATDVAARGLDIKGIDLILHYHVPRAADTYVHRSGRTARASASGKSILICSPDEVVGVARLAAKVHSEKSSSSKRGVQLQSVELDRVIIGRVKPRVTLAKRITDSTLAKEKLSAEDDWLRSAADDLGVDYDSDEFAEQTSKSRGRGRGGGREARQKVDGSLSKAELTGLRSQLKDLLSKKINLGVSEKYLTSGRVDIEALLRGEGNDAFLGQVEKLGF